MRIIEPEPVRTTPPSCRNRNGCRSRERLYEASRSLRNAFQDCRSGVTRNGQRQLPPASSRVFRSRLHRRRVRRKGGGRGGKCALGRPGELLPRCARIDGLERCLVPLFHNDSHTMQTLQVPFTCHQSVDFLHAAPSRDEGDQAIDAPQILAKIDVLVRPVRLGDSTWPEND